MQDPLIFSITFSFGRKLYIYLVQLCECFSAWSERRDLDLCPNSSTGKLASPSIHMLVLSAIHNLLTQILSLPSLHTAILLTREGQLVCTAHESGRSKDDIRVIVGLCAEVWREAGATQGWGMLDTEVRRFVF